MFSEELMIKMASLENNEDSVKPPITDEVNIKTQSKMDEKKSSTVSLPVDDEPSDAAAKEKKNSTSAATNDCTSVQKNDSDNIKNEDKDDSQPLIIDKKQDDNKTDEKQEKQDLISPTDLQNTNEEKEVKSEDSLTKGGSVLKRKRKTLRLVQTFLKIMF